MAEDARAVREAIEHDRAELAETVEALARKADVKERVREKVSRSAQQVQHKTDDVREQLRQVTPEQAQSGVQQLVRAIEERPLPFVVAALVVGMLIGRRLGRRRS
jgi:ElaB/YqjD/DUF883 family membrane-anchored ribosome-binding protein